MLQTTETSDKEKFEMYNMLSKETLIGMLIECNKHLQRLTPKINTDYCGFFATSGSDTSGRCINCEKQQHEH